PDDFPWMPNIAFVHHVPPPDHATFYCSSRLTLNVTRRAMAEMGYCPSGRLFEAAACGTPLVSDAWPGLERFFEPGSEILVASSADDVTSALSLGSDELAAVARRARERTLDEHTADRRVDDLLAALDGVAVGGPTAGAARASHAEA
ncbi:MAG TPA: glycosyltransferase, partial [Gammaproteobacteria bacterium]